MRFGGQEQPVYPALSALLGGDDDKVGKILRVFYRSAWKDLERLEQLASAGQWYPAMNLANRIAIGCRQIGEDAAAERFTFQATTAIERARADAAAGSGAFARLFQNARRELVDVLDRAAAYVAFAEPEA